MTTAHEIRNLIEQTATGTRRRRVPEEVKEQVRRYAERRRSQAATWKAIGRETGLEARKLLAWCRKAREVAPVPEAARARTLRTVVASKRRRNVRDDAQRACTPFARQSTLRCLTTLPAADLPASSHSVLPRGTALLNLATLAALRARHPRGGAPLLADRVGQTRRGRASGLSRRGGSPGHPKPGDRTLARDFK
jgi:hypothetical protein